MKAVGEQILQDAFVRVFDRMYENKDSFIRTLKANIQTILSKREDSEPLHEVVQNIVQLKWILKHWSTLSFETKSMMVYMMRNTPGYLSSWKNFG